VVIELPINLVGASSARTIDPSVYYICTRIYRPNHAFPNHILVGVMCGCMTGPTDTTVW